MLGGVGYEATTGFTIQANDRFIEKPSNMVNINIEVEEVNASAINRETAGIAIYDLTLIFN